MRQMKRKDLDVASEIDKLRIIDGTVEVKQPGCDYIVNRVETR